MSMHQYAKINRIKVLTQHKQAHQTLASILAYATLMGQFHSLKMSMRDFIPLYVSS